MSGDSEEREGLTEEARRFLSSFRSLILATASREGEPEASYAPFVRRPGRGFYVYVSELSRHTGNMLANPYVSALLICDERDAQQLFARTRLTFRCAAREVERGSSQWGEVLDGFESEFGQVVDLIRPLTDFHLLYLEPESAVYVRGFAQAYRFAGTELSQLLRVE